MTITNSWTRPARPRALPRHYPAWRINTGRDAGLGVRAPAEYTTAVFFLDALYPQIGAAITIPWTRPARPRALPRHHPAWRINTGRDAGLGVRPPRGVHDGCFLSGCSVSANWRSPPSFVQNVSPGHRLSTYVYTTGRQRQLVQAAFFIFALNGRMLLVLHIIWQ